MIDKAKVHELAIELHKCSVSVENNERLITEWLEQNQPEPVVVGLTDKQVEQLSYEVFQFIEEFYAESSDIPFASEIKRFVTRWLRYEDFTQEVKEVAVGLTTEQLTSLAARFAVMLNIPHIDTIGQCNEWKLAQIFTQPEAKEVVVGLSDEQLSLLCQNINNCFESGFTSFTPNELKLWLKTQTFAQPSDVAKRTISRLTDELKQCYDIIKSQQLPPKQRQFAVDWENAPEGANVARYYLEWFKFDDSDDFINLNATELVAQIERPKPTPEVGQVWQYKGETYVVTDIQRIKGKTKIGNEWVDGLELVNYHRGTNLVSIEFQSYTRTLSDFLAKFEKVSG